MSSETPQLYSWLELHMIVSNDWKDAKEIYKTLNLSQYGISGKSVIGSILEEFHDSKETIKDDLTQWGADKFVLNSSLNSIKNSYEKLRDQPTLWDQIKNGSISKTSYVSSIDVGRGNVQIYTAIYLLEKYNQQYPNSDPLNLKQYNNDYTKLVSDLINNEKSTTVYFAGLMVQNAAQWYQKNASNWNTLTQDQKDALIVYFYNVGERGMNEKATQAKNNGGSYKPDPNKTPIAQEYLKNLEELKKTIELYDLTNFCFAAETPILMSDGTYKPIEQIKIGDEVMAFDGLGELQPRKVTQTFITPDQEVVQLGNIKVTLGHHFLQADGSFKALGEIDHDGFLVGITGKLIPHPGIKPVAGKHTVYNFTVEDLHTYIAGDYRVHNESLSLYQPVTTGGLIGASIGSQIGAYFANDKFASQLVAQSLGKTVGSWTGDAIVYEFDLSDDPAFRNRSQESLSLGAIYRRLPGSVISTGIGLGSSKLANSLIKAFKIEDPLTQIAVSSLVVGSVSYYVTAEVAKSYPITAVKLFGAPSLKEGNIIIGVDSSKLSLTNSLANVAQSAFGSFAGSYLYSKLFKWNVLSEDVSVTGAKIGATIGAFAGSFIPIPVVGTAIGTLIGSVFGGLFGDKDYPRAFTSVIISNNQFILTPVAVDDKGNYDVAYNMGVAARDTLTTIAASIGGKPLSIREFRYGHFKKSYVYRPGDLGLSAYNYPWQYSSPQEAITNGIFQQVKSLQMEGGDIYVKRYLINLPGDVNTLDKLSAGFQVAREWGVYKDNPYLYEKTIQELDDNAISIADQQILELQKTPSQAQTLTNKDNKYVDFGLTTLPSKLTVSISGNNFIVNGKTVTPDQVVRFADGSRFKPVVRNGVVTLEAEQVANWLQIKPKAQALNLDTPQASDNYVGANASKIVKDNGGVGNDVLIASSGATLNGGQGDDVYVYSRGNGTVTINDVGGLDSIEFDASIKSSDLLVQQSGINLIIALKNPSKPSATISELTDKIVISDFFNQKIEILKFNNNQEVPIESLQPSFWINGSFQFTSRPQGLTAAFWQGNAQLRVGDFNGDGKDDIVNLQPDGNNWVALSNGNNTFQFVSRPQGLTAAFWQGNAQLGVGDFNGDGKDDIVNLQPDGNNWIALSNGNNTFQFVSRPQGLTAAFWKWNAQLRVGDFNGDGKDDIVNLQPDGNNWLALSNGNNTFQFTYRPQGLTGGFWQGNSQLQVGDFNGDGKDDIVNLQPDGNNWIALSNGNNTFQFTYRPQGLTAAFWQGAAQLRVGDFNKDGKDDIANLQPDGNNWLALSNGNTFQFVSKPEGLTAAFWQGAAQLQVGDFNGDGKDDIVNLQPDGNNWLASPYSETLGNDLWKAKYFYTTVSNTKDRNNLYQYRLGDGNTTIYDVGTYGGTTRDGGVDILEFGQNITLDSLKLKLDNNNLIVTVKDTNTITIQDWLKPQSQIEAFRLSDGKEYTVTLTLDSSVALQPLLGQSEYTPDTTQLPSQYSFSPYKLAVVDLTGDGIRLISAADSLTQYDIDTDTYPEQMGWVAPTDGFLVRDVNKDGYITTLNEFFSLTAQSNVTQLSTLDSNKDGLINASDTLFDELRTWTDTNLNGQVDLGELAALYRYGINNISVTPQTKDYTVAGNKITASAYFTRVGYDIRSTAKLYDVQFAYDPNGVILEQMGNGVSRFNYENKPDIIFADDSTQNINLTIDPNDTYSATGGTGNDILMVKLGSTKGAVLSGGDGNDKLTGADGNDILAGGAGNDTIDGSAGDDLITIDKDDNLNNIKGGTGFDVLVIEGDGDVNLILDNLGVEVVNGNKGNNNLKAIGSQNVIISGDAGNDTIIGGTGSDRLEGNTGNDVINGSEGSDIIDGGENDDILTGVNPQSTTPGKGEIDTFTGGTGRDKFILGDKTWIGYDDGNTTSAGNNDYASITDFNPKDDIIQLKGSSSNYLSTVSGTNTNLYINKPGTEPDELIAIIQNRTGLSLAGNYFSYFIPNAAPTNLTLSNSNIAENQAIGTVIGNFTTTDPNTGDTFTYSLVSGTGSTNNSLFAIQNNQLKTNAVFDYETKNDYSIRVRTTDQDGLSYEKALTINVTNIYEPPTLVGKYDTPGSAFGVQVVDNDAYVGNFGSGLEIIDISNPTNPTLKSSYNYNNNYVGYYGMRVQVVGKYAYIADGYSGLQIIDITNPSNPILKGSYDTSGFAQGVQVVSNYAYIADQRSGLQIVDITNPTKPTFKGNYDTSGWAYNLQIVGNYAYVAAGGSGLQIIDITNPAKPTLKGNYDTSDSVFDVQVVGNYAYITDSDSKLQIIDITNPTNPTLKGSYAIPEHIFGSNFAQSVQIVGNYAYVTLVFSGLQIINISNPANPTLVGSYLKSFVFDVQVVGNYAYVTDNTTGLNIIDVSEFNSPLSPSIALAVSASSVSEDGTTNLVYTFTRNGVTTNPLTVNYTVGGTATWLFSTLCDNFCLWNRERLTGQDF